MGLDRGLDRFSYISYIFIPKAIFGSIKHVHLISLNIRHIDRRIRHKEKSVVGKFYIEYTGARGKSGLT